VLRGSYSARIDDKGRLKIPTAFKSLIEDQLAEGLFITSVKGDSVRLYPLPVWRAIEERFNSMPTMEPSVVKFLERVNYFGQPGEVDSQGRVSIPPKLRESAGISGDVDVVGKVKYLELWNHARLAAKLESEPFTDDDARTLAALGI
jgi:MraZ protein